MIKILERDSFFVRQLSPLVVGEIGDLGDWTKVFDRVSVTIKAPPHGKHLVPHDDFHLVDSSVALHASDATIHVGGMIEVGVVGDAIHPHPLNRKPALVTLLDRLKLSAVGSNRRVAVHAGLRGWYGGVRRSLHGVVAIATVHAKFAGMERMTKRHWLRRLVTHLKRLRTKSVGHEHHHVQRQ